MKPFERKHHARHLEDERGLDRLVAESISESSEIDFKRSYDRRDPRYENTVRIDFGCMATSGTGFIVLGVADVNSCASAIPGIDAAETQSLKQSIESLVASHIDPPIEVQPGRVIPVAKGRCALVFRVHGKRGFPVGVTLDNGGTVFYQRSGSNNRLLTVQEAQSQRLQIQLRWAPALFVLATVMVVLSGALSRAVPQVVVPVSSLSIAPQPPPIQRPNNASEPFKILGEAGVLMNSRNFEAARSIVGRAEAIEPTWYAALLLARVALEEAKPKDALPLLDLAQDRYLALNQLRTAHANETRQETLTRILETPDADFGAMIWVTDPQLLQIQNLRTAALIQGGRHQDAVAAAKLALRLAPKNAFANSNLALALAHLGQFDDADIAIERALEAEPNDLVAISNRARIRMARGDPPEVVEAELDSVIQRDPAFGPAWAGLGENALRAGNFAVAADTFKRAISLLPRDPALRANLCVALRALEQVDAAVEQCELAVQIDPAMPLYWSNLAATLSATPGVDPRRAERVAEARRRAVAIAPHIEEQLNAYATCLAETSERAQCVRRLGELTKVATSSGQLAAQQSLLVGPYRPDEPIRNLFERNELREGSFAITLQGFRMPEREVFNVVPPFEADGGVLKLFLDERKSLHFVIKVPGLPLRDLQIDRDDLAPHDLGGEFRVGAGWTRESARLSIRSGSGRTSVVLGDAGVERSWEPAEPK